jgi:hypothetical protein
LDELLSALERLEAQNLAVLQFIKGQKKSADKLAPYLEQAEKTSSVKWMATRVRMNHLLDAAAKEAEREAEKSVETQRKSAGPPMKAEGNSESEDAKSKKLQAEKSKKVKPSENTSETEMPEPASQIVGTSSADKPSSQTATKPSSEKQATESAA